MSDYDRFGYARYGAGVARAGSGAIDQGLRAYMLGVYNYMTLGLGVTGLSRTPPTLARWSNLRRPLVGLTGFGEAILPLAAALGDHFCAAGVVFGCRPGATACRRARRG